MPADESVRRLATATGGRYQRTDLSHTAQSALVAAVATALRALPERIVRELREEWPEKPELR